MNNRSHGENLAGAVKSADRVLAIIEYLSDAGSAPFSQIVRDLGLPNSSGHQLLQTALSRRFVDFDEHTRMFRLGSRIWEVAQNYSVSEDLVSIAKPFMDELTASTKETVQLARLDGLNNIYLAISESPHVMKLVSSVGGKLPAHTTGLGKVLLAGLDDEEIDARLEGVELERFTSRTITDHAALKKELSKVRRQGFGEDEEEYVVGCRCIAMPVRDTQGTVISALSVSVPTPRYTPAGARTVSAELSAAVRKIEQRLSGMTSVEP